MQATLNPKETQRLWLPNLAPRKGLVLATFVALNLILAAVHVTLQQPRIGITWAPTRNGVGIMVRQVAGNLPISPGTRVVSLKTPDGRVLFLHSGMLIEDPDQYATYAAYNKFFGDQQRLLEHYTQNPIILVGEDGRQWPLSIQKHGALGHLPSAFWILNLTAALCFLIGCGIWWYRRGTATGRLLAITGFGYFLSILCLSVYGSREIVMDPLLFRSLSAANHLFTLTWCYSLLLMLAIYPSRMGGKKAIGAAYSIALAIWLNQTFQWVEVPIHAHYGLTFLATYMAGVILGYLQWRRTAHRPVERAVLRWFILSILINIGMAGALFITPAITHDYGVIPLWVPALSVLLMFIGFAFGILRYGLFSLERWWFIGWVWLASGLLITAIDGLLVVILEVSFEKVLPYSIMLLGWIYFPIRQWLWHRIAKPETYHLEHHLPALIQSLFDSGCMQTFIDRWSELLSQVYKPLKVSIDQGTGGPIKIEQHGLEIQIPGIDGSHFSRLVGNRKGTRLFGPKDVELAKALLSISHAIFAITNRTQDVQQKGAEDERERIMRDLHDDVLPKLITIKHQSPTSDIANLAETAFQSIRETIYILRYPSRQPLADALADWRGELAERLEPTPLKLVWQAPRKTNGHHLTPRQFVNCGRILREAVSNIIQHADATTVSISFVTEKKHFHLSISDDGQGGDTINGIGLGVNNMRLRTTALDGKIAWLPNESMGLGQGKGLTVKVSIPIHNEG